jgi:hypothetical protein
MPVARRKSELSARSSLLLEITCDPTKNCEAFARGRRTARRRGDFFLLPETFGRRVVVHPSDRGVYHAHSGILSGKRKTMPSSVPRTTKFSRTVTTIADIKALERLPYDELVPARNLYQLFEATARLHPARPALTVMPSGDPEESAVTLSHKGLLEEITRAANLFRSLGISPSGGRRCFPLPGAAPDSAGSHWRSSRGRRQHDQLSAQCRRHRRSPDRRTGDGAGHSLRSR